MLNSTRETISFNKDSLGATVVTIKKNAIGVFLNNERVTVHHEVFSDPWEHAKRCEQVLNNGWMILHVWERYDAGNGFSIVLLYAKPEHEDCEIIVDASERSEDESEEMDGG